MRRLLSGSLALLAAAAAQSAPAEAYRAATPAPASPRPAVSRKVIVDQDALGGPGLQPILMLLQDPGVEVLGITTVSGDGWQPEETAQVLRMLELIGRTDVPVIAGATYPLINNKARNAARETMYGALAYRGAWTDKWPVGDTMNRRRAHAPDIVPAMAEGMPTTSPLPISAADFMIEQTRRYPGQVTIIAMGPLTNLALAQRLDDGFAARTRELVTEGGNLMGTDPSAKQDIFGNQVAYAPRMSFNHYWDPEAAHIVFTGAWPRLMLVTNDAATPAIADKALLDRATAHDTQVTRYVRRIAEPGFPLWDEVEAAAWLDPGAVSRQGTLAMDVDLMPGANYGALLTWPAGLGPHLGERDVDVVYAINVDRVKAMFAGLVGR